MRVAWVAWVAWVAFRSVTTSAAVLVVGMQRAIAAPAPSPGPSPFLEALADDDRPLRRGFTFELGFGASLTYVAREQADGETGLGPTTLAVGVGGFVTPKLALLARWAGTTYFDKTMAGETTQLINELGGFHVQYWANDWISLSAGPALAIVGPNPLFAAEGGTQVGFGGSARVGYSVFSAKHHAVRVSWETFNSKIADAFLYGTAISLEWQTF